MTPLKHQIEFATKCWDILKEKGYVYLAGKPRTGKTYTSILTAEMSDKINSVLVLTKKAAIPGWLKFIENNPHLRHKYTVTNYGQVGKIRTRKKSIIYDLKLNPEEYQLVIIDESHNLGSLGRPSNRIKLIKRLCQDLPHIHLSGTAIVESPCSIYPQMSISKFTPFHHKNFYEFHKEYGIPYYIKAAGREINQYDKANMELLMPVINEFTIYMTQEDAGISSDVQATDELHFVELDKKTKDLYNQLQEDLIIDLNGLELVCDSTMKLRTSLHMLEAGVAKVGDEYVYLGNTEKINYIKEKFGDTEDVGIMCHFIPERELFYHHFDNANIYSSNAHAEGVDLSHLKHFIIASSDYSGSKFIQRRDRIVNVNGSNTTTVHHILVKNAISHQVYKKVSKKEDFNNSTYEAITI